MLISSVAYGVYNWLIFLTATLAIYIDEILQLDYVKEVKYVERNRTPGLTFRRGKTNHSYQWIAIVPGSPVATRTRTKLKI